MLHVVEIHFPQIVLRIRSVRLRVARYGRLFTLVAGPDPSVLTGPTLHAVILSVRETTQEYLINLYNKT